MSLFEVSNAHLCIQYSNYWFNFRRNPRSKCCLMRSGRRLRLTPLEFHQWTVPGILSHALPWEMGLVSFGLWTPCRPWPTRKSWMHFALANPNASVKLCVENWTGEATHAGLVSQLLGDRTLNCPTMNTVLNMTRCRPPARTSGEVHQCQDQRWEAHSSDHDIGVYRRSIHSCCPVFWGSICSKCSSWTHLWSPSW